MQARASNKDSTHVVPWCSWWVDAGAWEVLGICGPLESSVDRIFFSCHVALQMFVQETLESTRRAFIP